MKVANIFVVGVDSIQDGKHIKNSKTGTPSIVDDETLDPKAVADTDNIVAKIYPYGFDGVKWIDAHDIGGTSADFYHVHDPSKILILKRLEIVEHSPKQEEFDNILQKYNVAKVS